MNKTEFREALKNIPKIEEEVIRGEFSKRFQGALWVKEMEKLDILLLGLGGIGSNTVYQLARLNPKKIHIVDNDKVESSNISGQWYSKYDTGGYKVKIVLDRLFSFLDWVSVQGYETFIDEHTLNNPPYYMNTPIMIVGFDNMKARKIAFDIWMKSNKDNPNALFIDARCSLEEVVIYAIKGGDAYNQEAYLKEWFSDDEAEKSPCTLQQTTFVSTLAGSLITNTLVNWVSTVFCNDMRAVPYKQEFHSPTCFYNTVDSWQLN